MPAFLLRLFLAVAVAGGVPVRAGGVPVIRRTTLGLVQGASDGNVSRFASIPFAAPPLGKLRFRAPQPATPWEGVKDVTAEPNVCPQFKDNATTFRGSEDCLYLHVWTPDDVPKGNLLPVMVWMYGGAYVFGSSSKGIYDGSRLAQDRRVVVVVPNYRLGILGFAALPALQAEDPDGSTGNAALQDQTAALRWVRENAAAFGGDPSRVLLFGESAGGFSVAWHLVSGASAGLFSAAAMESGTTDATEFFRPLKDAIAFTELFGSSCGGCNATLLRGAAGSSGVVPGASASDPLLDCLRALPTVELLKTLEDALAPDWPFGKAGVARPWGRLPPGLQFCEGSACPPLAPLMPWGPAIDGSRAGLRGLPLALIRAGEFSRVPFLLGTNRDEGSLFAPGIPFVVPNLTLPLSDADLGRVIEQVFGAYNATELALLVPTILAAYPSDEFRGEWAKAAALITDCFFACSARRTARALAAQHSPAWLYQFSANLSNWEDYRAFGDHHDIEIAFVFRNDAPLTRHVFDEDEWELADAMSGYWSNLAAAGDPNAGPAPVPLAWPRYAEVEDESLQLELPPLGITRHLKAARCDMWDSVLADLDAHGGIVNLRR